MLDVVVVLRLLVVLDVVVLRLFVEILRMLVVFAAIVGLLVDRPVVLAIKLRHVLVMWDQVVVETSMKDYGY